MSGVSPSEIAAAARKPPMSRGRTPAMSSTKGTPGRPDPQGGRIIAPGDRLGDQPGDRSHLVRTEPPCGRRRRPDADPGRCVRRERVERDGVLVDRDPNLLEE